jgi:hypothetical protein
MESLSHLCWAESAAEQKNSSASMCFLNFKGRGLVEMDIKNPSDFSDGQVYSRYAKIIRFVLSLRDLLIQ